LSRNEVKAIITKTQSKTTMYKFLKAHKLKTGDLYFSPSLIPQVAYSYNVSYRNDGHRNV